MPIHKDQRVGVFIDVQNLYYSAKQFYGAKVNFAHILKKAVAGRNLIRAIAYVIKADIKEEHNFFEALEKIGYDVRAKELQTFYTGAKKGDWDVGIAMDIMRMASKLDVIVIVSGDGDFKDLLEHVKALGCRAEVIAFGKTASSRLTNEADDFHDLGKDLEKVLIKDNKYHPKPNDNNKVIQRKGGVENIPYQRPDGSFEKRAPVPSTASKQSSVVNSKPTTRPPVKRNTSNKNNRSQQRPPRFERKPQSSQRSFRRDNNYNRNNNRDDAASLLQRINMEQPDLTKAGEKNVVKPAPAQTKKPVKKTSGKKPKVKDSKKPARSNKKPIKSNKSVKTTKTSKKPTKKKESVVQKVIKKVTGKKKK